MSPILRQLFAPATGFFRRPFFLWVALPFVAALSVPVAKAAPNSIPCDLADGFDYPVGRPDAVGYYKARGFWPNGHLGEDWNGRGGGNTDLGDPVTCAGDGVVVYSDDFKAGWGNVIIVRHAYRERNGRIYFIDTLYGHLDKRMAKLYDRVKRGEQLGTIGRGPHNMYYAHLHFEVRKNLSIGMKRSNYAQDYSNYHSPTHFIDANRRLRKEFRRIDIPVNTFYKDSYSYVTGTRIEISRPTVAEAKPQVPEPVAKIMSRNDGTGGGREADQPKPQEESNSDQGEGARGLWKVIKSIFSSDEKN